VLLCIVGVCVFIEMILQGANHVLWGSQSRHGLAYQNGGFWRGLLTDWRLNYPRQPVAMFDSYGFLHGGFLCVLVDMITLASLGWQYSSLRISRWWGPRVHFLGLAGAAHELGLHHLTGGAYGIGAHALDGGASGLA